MLFRLKPLVFCMTLPFGLAWADAPHTPAQIALQLEAVCKGADQMLLSAMPGRYVSCSIAGEACDGVYLPGRGAVIKFRVAFPLLPAASTAAPDAQSGEPALPAPTPAEPQSATANHIEIQIHQLLQSTRSQLTTVSQVAYQHTSNQGYDATRCRELRAQVGRILAHYSEPLSLIPEDETITVVIRGPADCGQEAARGPRPPQPSRALLPISATFTPAGLSYPSGPSVTTLESPAPVARWQGRSTMILTLPRNRLSSDAAQVTEAFEVSFY